MPCKCACRRWRTQETCRQGCNPVERPGCTGRAYDARRPAVCVALDLQEHNAIGPVCGCDCTGTGGGRSGFSSRSGLDAEEGGSDGRSQSAFLQCSDSWRCPEQANIPYPRKDLQKTVSTAQAQNASAIRAFGSLQASCARYNYTLQ